jgi:hypothetical protein
MSATTHSVDRRYLTLMLTRGDRFAVWYREQRKAA